jgi:Uma2 family endonuclease
MATVTRRPHPDVVVLHRVPFKHYVHLTKVPANRHFKMAYHDGTLEIVSPQLLHHEEPGVKFRWIVMAVCRHRKIPFRCSAGATFSRSGEGVFKGVGKEADESYYIANMPRLPRDRDPDLDAGDPPPDLWIEVDNRVSSKGRLPVYAGLGVPEVWRFRSRSRRLQFLGLVDGSYEPIEQSLSFPMLTPALVLEALALGNDPSDYDYLDLLGEWVIRTFPLPAAGD